jgi:hypothetical protein
MNGRIRTFPPEVSQFLNERQQIKKVERSNAAKTLRMFSKDLKAFGYFRKSTFFARERQFLAHFLHVHKFSFGPHFRIHACIRVLNDSRSHMALLGISSGECSGLALSYGPTLEEMRACSDLMIRYVTEVAEPWFEKQVPSSLLKLPSILPPEDRAGLEAALEGRSSEEYVERSRSLLGLA